MANNLRIVAYFFYSISLKLTLDKRIVKKSRKTRPPRQACKIYVVFLIGYHVFGKDLSACAGQRGPGAGASLPGPAAFGGLCGYEQ